MPWLIILTTETSTGRSPTLGADQDGAQQELSVPGDLHALLAKD